MAALALLVALPARAAEVVSQNTVGYKKVNLNTGYNMLGVQFTKVGGGDKTLGDVFTGNLPDMEYDEQADALVWNAKLLQWNGGGYNTYYWVGKKGEEIFEDASYDDVWVADELGENKASGSLPIGDGVFLWTSGSGVTVTQSGEVATNATKDVTLSLGYNLVCNPFPEAISIQDIPFSGLPDMEYDEQADALVWNAKLLQWNGGGYNTYYWVGKKGEEIFEDTSYDDVWVADELGENKASGTIGIGDGFFVWLNKGDSAKISFTK